MEFAISEQAGRSSTQSTVADKMAKDTIKIIEEIRRRSKRNAMIDLFWTSVAQESVWIRSGAKHKRKHRPVVYRPKTGGNVTSLRAEAVFSFPSSKRGNASYHRFQITIAVRRTTSAERTGLPLLGA